MLAAAREAMRVERRGELIAVQWQAMASPCELLVATQNVDLARRLGQVVAGEAWRIEHKYSRYRDDSVVGVLNHSNGAPVALDPETMLLLQFAARCHELSAGAFDITSGVLRRAWRFDAGARMPDAAQIAALRARIGFERLRFEDGALIVPPGMELDFGGIGKEYAVDCALALALREFDGAMLVNFGGDIAANAAPASGPWKVGVERPDEHGAPRLLLDFERGGLATSGDTHRYFEHAGKRYGHILDVRSGYPVEGAPRSVTVAAACCLEAGMIATLAMLQGAGAEEFLAEQGVPHWCLR
jgi:thiamine biosynthesis lipoprotein